MIQYEHTITPEKDQWFLDMGMKDSYVQQVFGPGDCIVVCASCKKVWLAISWEDQNCCPAGGCGCGNTIRFSKQLFVLPKKVSGFGEKIIFRGIVGVDFTYWERLGFIISEGKLGQICAGMKKIRYALAGIALLLAIYQFNTEDSQINGKTKSDYQSIVGKCISEVAAVQEHAAVQEKGRDIALYIMGQWEQKGNRRAFRKVTGRMEEAVAQAEEIKEKIAEVIEKFQKKDG